MKHSKYYYKRKKKKYNEKEHLDLIMLHIELYIKAKGDINLFKKRFKDININIWQGLQTSYIPYVL